MIKKARRQIVSLFGLAMLFVMANTRPGRAEYFDHHVHLLSPTLMTHWKSLGMRFSRVDEAYSDPRRVLKEEGLAGAFLVSMAHLYSTEAFQGIESVRKNERELVQAENDFVATCVASDRRKLVGFFSVNPLASYAMDEMKRCKALRDLAGLKLHLPACEVDLHNRVHSRRLAEIFSWAERERVPILLHLLTGNGSDSKAATEFWQLVKPHKRLSLYLAHLGAAGGYNGSSEAVLHGFERLCKTDAAFRTAEIWFDLSGAVLVEETDGFPATSKQDCISLTSSMRRIGVSRFLFASDYPVFSAKATASALRSKLSLSADELTQLLKNRSPEFDTLLRMP